MLKKIVAAALAIRTYVVLAAVFISLYGLRTVQQLPVDVFPDMNRPYVNILVEAEGYAPEEIEKLISFPIETSMNGAPGVFRVRSSSGIGLAVITVEFDWGWDIYLCRQIVQERLQLVQGQLPEGTAPFLAPVASVTGEIMRLALTSDGTVSPIELRTIADWDVRLQLLTVGGVAQIIDIGGGVKQYQVLVDPLLLAKYDVTIDEVEETLQGTNINTPGGFAYDQGEELLVRNIGRPDNPKDFENLVIKKGEHGSIRLHHVAKILEGRKVPRGTAGINGQDAVVMTLMKQPDANTLELTERLRVEIDRIRENLPDGVTLHEVYEQALFIDTAVHNVIEALRDGSILVVIIIVLFLLNLRMSFIILISIPLCFITTALVFSWFGMSVNTMTLGGLAVAVGELVDSAIVGAENIYRRLRENQAKPRGERQPLFKVITNATDEVFTGIVLGTAIVLFVVMPLFALPGVVGRLFTPIGTAYLVSILTSMIVSITVTPVLCSFLLNRKLPDIERDTFLVRFLKQSIKPVVYGSIKFRYAVVIGSIVLCLWALVVVLTMGKDLLPEFNEGSAYVIVMAPPGINLDESSKLGIAVEEAMMKVPEIGASITGRRTGRAEGDEHAIGVNISEIEAELENPKNGVIRPRAEIMADIRGRLAEVPGIITEVQQPIQHRISAVISGARTQIVIKIFGPNLGELRRLGKEVHAAIKDVPGVVDDYVEQQALVPQIRITPKYEELAMHGMKLTHVLSAMETALQGKIFGTVLEGERYFDFIVRGVDTLREQPDTIANLLLTSPTGAKVPLRAVADIERSMGPNEIFHENSRRRIYVMCNVAEADLGSVVNQIDSKLRNDVEFPEGYTWSIGGQYEQMVESTRTMTTLSLVAFFIILSILVVEFRSFPLAVIILLNIPMALIGSVLALVITNTTVNMGALVGFIALCGIASRNGILLISHFITLVHDEGEDLTPQTILRGCQERLTPVLMTALTTNLGLIPLVLAKGEPGKEILYPVALVIFGGLLSSTILDWTITPATVWMFGRKGILRGKKGIAGNGEFDLEESESTQTE
ncbi:MAG: efflux RND transporter permease subunit [Candidatus Omnitrophica bacterium]|nr:efflux RND transporter permease subunit [Candidatus Omnitrophota bacterium]MCB9781627.1 efflux RND transporter permease subunit [Candidatus Omnitrophota bacterium]